MKIQVLRAFLHQGVARLEGDILDVEHALARVLFGTKQAAPVAQAAPTAPAPAPKADAAAGATAKKGK